MNKTYIVKQDGDQWFATTDNFINLQESDVVWNDTPAYALESLITEIGARRLVDEGHYMHGMVDPKYFEPHRTFDYYRDKDEAK